MKSKAKKSGFSIIELLTVMSIIIILLGILMPSLGAVRRYARKVRQKGMFHDISKCLESFSIDHDGYPDSSPFDLDNDSYCGAMKLCEAMVGQDGMGFHPDSIFDDKGKPADKNLDDLYFNRTPLTDEDDPQGVDKLNLQARQICLQGEDIQIGSMQALYENNLVGTAGDFDANCPVLCDVFKRHQLRVGAEKAGMPILYYKADTSKLLHESDEVKGPYNAWGNIYNYYDNYDLIILGVPWSGEIHAYEDIAVPNRDEIFFNQTRNKDIKTMDKPRKPNSYILQSAGWDGKYGTEDDVFNFDN